MIDVHTESVSDRFMRQPKFAGLMENISSPSTHDDYSAKLSPVEGLRSLVVLASGARSCPLAIPAGRIVGIGRGYGKRLSPSLPSNALTMS